MNESNLPQQLCLLANWSSQSGRRYSSKRIDHMSTSWNQCSLMGPPEYRHGSPRPVLLIHYGFRQMHLILGLHSLQIWCCLGYCPFSQGSCLWSFQVWRAWRASAHRTGFCSHHSLKLFCSPGDYCLSISILGLIPSLKRASFGPIIKLCFFCTMILLGSRSPLVIALPLEQLLESYHFPLLER